MFLTDRKRQGVTVEPVTPSKQGIPMPKPPSSAPGHSGAAIGPRLRVDMGLANSQGAFAHLIMQSKKKLYMRLKFLEHGAGRSDFYSCANQLVNIFHLLLQDCVRAWKIPIP